MFDTTIRRNEDGELILPKPDKVYADHSYPAYSPKCMRVAFERIAALEAQLARAVVAVGSSDNA